MQQPHEIYNYLKEIEGVLKTETSNIKNKRFINLLEYLGTQSEQTSQLLANAATPVSTQSPAMLSKHTQWEKDMAKGTKVFNFILFHRGTIEHVPQHVEILIKEIQAKFYN